jgi:hypothetical protein
VPSQPQSTVATWIADATVLSVTNAGAREWAPPVGQTRTGILWRTTITGELIVLEEDLANYPTDHIPFSGGLADRRFTASYQAGPDYLRYLFQFKGGTLTGTFSEDLSSFEAFETLVWGPPDDEMAVHLRWTGSRR